MIWGNIAIVINEHISCGNSTIMIKHQSSHISKIRLIITSVFFIGAILVIPIVFRSVVYAAIQISSDGRSLTDTPTWTTGNPPTIKIGSEVFKVSDSDKKVYLNSEVYYPTRGGDPKTCSSKIVFDKNPTAKDGGQTAKLYIKTVSTGQDACDKGPIFTLALAKASRINENKKDGDATPGSTAVDGDADAGADTPVSGSNDSAPLCSPTDPKCVDEAMNCGESGSGDCGLIEKYINPFVRFLSAFAALASVIGILYGSILYITSSGDANAAAKAKNIIRNAIIAFVAFLFLWAFMTWLMPAGWLET